MLDGQCPRKMPRAWLRCFGVNSGNRAWVHALTGQHILADSGPERLPGLEEIASWARANIRFGDASLVVILLQEEALAAVVVGRVAAPELWVRVDIHVGRQWQLER